MSRHRTNFKGEVERWLELNYDPSSNTACRPRFKYEPMSTMVTDGSAMHDYVGPGRPDRPVTHITWKAEPVEWVHNIDMYPSSGALCSVRRHYLKWNVEPATVMSLVNALSLPYPNPSIADVWDRWSNPFGNNLTETLLGLPEAKDLLKSVRGRLNWLKNVPKAIRGLPRNLKPNRLKAMVKGITADTLSTYLEWEFGWKQTGEDLAKLYAFVGSMEGHTRKMIDQQGQVVRIGFKRSGSISTDGPISIQANGVSRITYKMKYHFISTGLSGVFVNAPVQQEILQRISAAADFWGLQRSPGKAWDIAPASWLIDQLLPIGDLLDDLGNSNSFFGVKQQIDFLGSVSSQKLNFTLTQTQPSASFHAHGAHFNWESSEAEATGTLYRRTPSFSPPPSISVRARDNGVSNTGKAYIGLVGLSKI